MLECKCNLRCCEYFQGFNNSFFQDEPKHSELSVLKDPINSLFMFSLELL